MSHLCEIFPAPFEKALVTTTCICSPIVKLLWLKVDIVNVPTEMNFKIFFVVKSAWAEIAEEFSFLLVNVFKMITQLSRNWKWFSANWAIEDFLHLLWNDFFFDIVQIQAPEAMPEADLMMFILRDSFSVFKLIWAIAINYCCLFLATADVF